MDFIVKIVLTICWLIILIYDLVHTAKAYRITPKKPRSPEEFFKDCGKEALGNMSLAFAVLIISLEQLVSIWTFK